MSYPHADPEPVPGRGQGHRGEVLAVQRGRRDRRRREARRDGVPLGRLRHGRRRNEGPAQIAE